MERQQPAGPRQVQSGAGNCRQAGGAPLSGQTLEKAANHRFGPGFACLFQRLYSLLAIDLLQELYRVHLLYLHRFGQYTLFP